MKDNINEDKDEKIVNFLFFLLRWVIPFIPIVVLLIWNLIEMLEGKNKMSDGWLTALISVLGVIAGSFITLIGTIVISSKKNATKNDTKEIIQNNKDTLNRIGNKDNQTLFGQFDKKIGIKDNSTLFNETDKILEKLNNVDNYVIEEQIKKKILGDSSDYLKFLGNDLSQSKKIIETLQSEYDKLYSMYDVVKNENKNQEKEISNLKEKNKELQKKLDKNKEPGFFR